MSKQLEIEHITTRWNYKNDESHFFEYKIGDITGIFSINSYEGETVRYFVSFHHDPPSEEMNEDFREDESRRLFSSEVVALDTVKQWIPIYFSKLTQ